MKLKGILSLIVILAVFFQFSCDPGPEGFTTHFLPITDTKTTLPLSAYYDLRDRSTLIQVTNPSNVNARIHVQIFQHDRGCDELNFFDDLTPNDTVIYNMEDVIRNDGTKVPINLADDSYGYVVVNLVSDGDSFPGFIVGNFRIVDITGYEYRTNMAFFGYLPFPLLDEFVDFVNWFEEEPFDIRAELLTEFPPPLYANFNTVDGAHLSDVVGFSYFRNTNLENFGPPGDADDDDGPPDSVINYDNGVKFDVFVFDMNEEPLSCDSTVFACGGVMNYGINEDYRASRGSDLICPGGGLANPDGGYISFENGTFVNYMAAEFPGDDDDDFFEPDIPFQLPFFIGLIGLNNGDGTGSMDYWYGGENILFVEEDEGGITSP